MESIKGYEIIREISRGPISTAYLARQLSLQRHVLIKRLNTQWMDQADLMERFRREALICARLKHPNIVDIIDVETQPENLYLVIEYIEGMDLAAFIKQFSPVPFSRILFICREILKGLAYAHSQGVIHRDIKPSNIMLGRDGAVKIADFGLARTADLPTISAHGEVVGTPAYMSPEQARVSQLDERSDLFSLGITLYELAAGTSPFKGGSIVESIQKLLREVPPSLHTLRDDIPQWFSGLVDQLLSKKLGDRPVSAEALLQMQQFQEVSSSARQLAGDLQNSIHSHVWTSAAEPSPAVIQPVKLPENAFKRRMSIAALIVSVIVFGIWLMDARQENGPLQGLTIAAQTETSAIDSTAQAQNPEADSQMAVAGQPAAQPAENSSQSDAGTKREPVTEENNTPAAINPPVNQPAAADTPIVAAAENVPPERTAPAEGHLQIQCSPWAHVFINGEKRDTTPLREPLLLPAGRHVVELRNPDFPPVQKVVQISGGKTDSLVVNLHSYVGYLQLQVTPWAQVYLDDRYLETTPLRQPLVLSPGQYTLKLVNPAFPVWQDTLTIRAQQTLQRRISLNN